MANTNYEFIYTVEDYSGITTSVVMADGQSRWFDNVTGLPATTVIQITGDGTTSIAAMVARHPVRNKTFDVIDTDSADVAATTPSNPIDGYPWTVVNSGSSGNHVTGLPGTISLGDGKRISFIYDNTNSLWRYEDVAIDEYVSSGQTVTKWAGGRMDISGVVSGTADVTTASGNVFATSSAPTHSWAESFATGTDVTAQVNWESSAAANMLAIVLSSTSATQLLLQLYTTLSFSSRAYSVSFLATGSWKTGV